MNASIYFQPGLLRPTFSMPDALVVSFDGYDSWSFTSDHCQRDQYENACRFLRLVERGYSPERAYEIGRAVGSSPTLNTFERVFETCLHDKLVDEIPPFIPAGYMVKPTSIYEFAQCELDQVFKAWYRDGGEAVVIFCEEYDADYDEIMAYIRGRAQAEDEVTGDWSFPHHSALVSY